MWNTLLVYHDLNNMYGKVKYTISIGNHQLLVKWNRTPLTFFNNIYGEYVIHYKNVQDLQLAWNE